MRKYPTLQLFISVVLFTFILLVLWTQTNVAKLTVHTQDGPKDFYVELADSEFEKFLGLQGRKMLDKDRGMLFLYDEENDPAFWMKDTLISLDIIFISSDRKINGIAKNARPCTEEEEEIHGCPTYRSANTSKYVLELAGGSADKYGLDAGDSVEFLVGL